MERVGPGWWKRESGRITHGLGDGLIVACCCPARPLSPPQKLHAVFALREALR